MEVWRPGEGGPMGGTVPAAIVACLEQLAAAIWQWVREHPDATLAEQEEALLGLVRAALPELMRCLLYACTSALTSPAAGAPRCCGRSVGGTGAARSASTW